MKPDNWRTDYDWTDPDDYPVQDDKMFDIQSEEELMLPHEIKAPPKGIESLREGQRFADADPIEKKILELMARGLSRELAEVIVKSGMSEDSYEIMDKAEGGRIGFYRGSDRGEFSLSERLNPRDAPNQLIAEHMQIGKLPHNITARIFELNRGGKSYEDIAEITGVDIEHINSMLEVANRPDRIDPVDKQGKVDYDIWDDINLEREQIRDRPEHLDYIMRGQKIRKADGGRIGYDNGGDVMMASAPDPMDERNSMMENLAREYFGKPLKFLNEREIIEIEEMMDNMDPYGSKPMAPQDIQMAAQGGRIGYTHGGKTVFGDIPK